MGCRGWKEKTIFQSIQKWHLAPRIHFLDFVPPGNLVQLYQGARALINVSLVEGFGLSVLEAMACRTPVLCSQTTALGEVGQGSAILLDPHKETDITQALEQFFSMPEPLRKERIEKAQQKAQQFQWQKAVAQVIDLYNCFRYFAFMDLGHNPAFKTISCSAFFS